MGAGSPYAVGGQLVIFYMFTSVVLDVLYPTPKMSVNRWGVVK